MTADEAKQKLIEDCRALGLPNVAGGLLAGFDAELGRNGSDADAAYATLADHLVKLRQVHGSMRGG